MHFKIKKFLTLILLCNFFTLFSAKKADLIAFSYNRPMQLYALLESIEKYITGLQEEHVIYRADKEYATAYEIVKKRFPKVIYHKQGENPHQDFKPLVLKATFESPSKYVIFAVDDIIVKDYINIPSDIEILEKTNAYGFFFRLGLHLTECYPAKKSQKIPPIKHVTNDIYTWVFKQGEYDWMFPNTVDMTLYRKKRIEQDLREMNYKAPNDLEAEWWYGKAHKFIKLTGLCHKESKIINIPLNSVQHIHGSGIASRNMNFSTKQLLAIYNDNLKINITPLFRIKNKSAHIDYMPKFIPR